MKYNIVASETNHSQYDVVVLGVYEEASLCGSAKKIDAASDGYLSKVIAKGDFTGKLSQTLLLQDVASISRVLLVGCGKSDGFDIDDYISVSKTAISEVTKLNVTSAYSALTERLSDGYQAIRKAVETAQSESYVFDQLKSKKADSEKPEITLTLGVAAEQEDTSLGLTHGLAIASGMKICKDVMNMPPNICNPAYLAKEATALSQAYDKLNVDVLGEDKMHELGMNSYLAVGQGSINESTMSILSYSGGKSDDQPIVLVGKGLTFDSGGLSIKPAASMEEMKYDMGGAAGVLGAMKAICELDLPINVIGVLAGCENMPDGSAYRPSDILTTMSGKTVEVVNTDAEGRLVLCDVLTYVERFNPKFVVDTATLTGACVVALGSKDCGLFSADDTLAASILSASETSNDTAWRMPLHKSHKESLKSPFADICHAGGRFGGAITAAAFLWEFTDAYPWAHLDVAGTAWTFGNKNKGASGRPVPLLTQLVLDQVQ